MGALQTGIGRALLASSTLVLACARAPSAAVPDAAVAVVTEGADEPLQPLPPAPAVDARHAALGARLFADQRLSNGGGLSCATCHPLDRGGSDGLAHSPTAGGRLAAVNTPTVFNVAYSYRFNWTGAYSTLESELDAPIRRAMGTDWAGVLARIARTDDYAAAFRAAYPAAGLTEDTVRDAFVAFERTLVTPGARFDRWLQGDREALRPDELEGYELFTTYGCASCHQGANIGGNMQQAMGLMADYFAARGGPTTPADNGLLNTTGDPRDRHVFRVPSLRNVAVTAPYFHDGSAATLDAAIDAMAHYQLGRRLRATQVERIAAFLRTLTGEYQGRPLDAP